jgi:hypothetical protein
MFEGTEDTHEHRESDSEGLGQQPDAGHPAGEDVGAPEEGAGARAAAASPEISEDANKEETQRPAPDDDVGVPDNPGDHKDED